ncbi:protein kinase domain-containing protein [Tunturiibacter psychrotolerans]|uniref:protein kinase domain-containing protein n=1 Tax=Tunturiibacter psychrotolerans TaxID=3069686 RepID=UPI003D22C8ED
MELWTEYEGRTIDGAFPLTKLIRPEGRSAFFSTSDGVGGPTVIRLIESHFDDEEILVRWRGIQVLNHPNLVKLIQFGRVTLDETALVYAVMEPVDANMGEIVAERRLTTEETKQIATSLLTALEALHSNGFVHEHIEPANVLAVGEAIKLRSDCIRETPEGQEGRELKSRDVHDYAVVLLQALTQSKTLEAAKRYMPLAAPFNEIVPKGMSGEWGLEEIHRALRPDTVRVEARPVTAKPVVTKEAGAGIVAQTVVEELPSYPSERVRVPVEEEPRGIEGRRLAIGVGAMLLLAVVALFVHGRAKSGAVQANASVPAIATEGSASAPTPALETPAPEPVAAVPAVAKPEASVPAAATTATNGAGQWRVVAFTYNGEKLAQQKAASVAAKHPDLRPEVFTPSGHAPYLVTVGGAMTRDQAFALVKKGRAEGLPRDSYAQNYRR